MNVFHKITRPHFMPFLICLASLKAQTDLRNKNNVQYDEQKYRKLYHTLNTSAAIWTECTMPLNSMTVPFRQCREIFMRRENYTTQNKPIRTFTNENIQALWMLVATVAEEAGRFLALLWRLYTPDTCIVAKEGGHSGAKLLLLKQKQEANSIWQRLHWMTPRTRHALHAPPPPT